MLTQSFSEINQAGMTMARRNDHSKEEIQSMAIDAVRALISKQGLDGVSARKVAQKMGYTVGTLYQSFENIHDLVLQANAFSLTELLAQLETPALQKMPPHKRVIGIAEAYLNFAQSHERQWSAIFKHSLPDSHLIPDWYQARIDALFATLENSLQTLSPKHSRKDIKLASRVLWSGVHGICLLHVGDKLFSNNIATPQILIHSLINNYLTTWVKEGHSDEIKPR